jgi:glycosyltransferase involved in cell wall biosynthesis
MIYLVMYKFSHHSSVSGYNRLADFVPCARITVPQAVGSIFQNLASQAMREQLKQTTGLTGYFPESRWLEWWTAMLAKIPVSALFHFIYPENSYYFVAQQRTSRRARFVATYHQPFLESTQFILKTEAIRKLDAVILLAECQREFFEPIVGKERIFVVPHGIDVKYFTPSLMPARERRVIAVGSWLRDFATLRGAVRLLGQRAPDLLCDVVASEHHRSLFQDLANVRFHSGISDAALRSLYQKASLSVLSLNGAGANNALLESMACGVPIVATDLPGVREYTVAGGCRYVPPGDSPALAEAVVSLIEDTPRLAAMSDTNRNHANLFAWETVGQRTMKVYQAVSQA